ncbi:AEC family transporter [Magnetospira sp. QH-2]|uniref:AEC family transporter n=1 Tax=Magnetospira sp. (strain QH-2) TaxID=1288970 RepID=UPI0003E80FB1|nr:AEC family transporter [Magnetospira sp. QH-2]CCQ72685.1 Conserved protein of unknown function; putative transporter [Magnetospira sp. QH-2]
MARTRYHPAMESIVTIVLPVFGIILTGYLTGHFRILGDESSAALNRFVYAVALPALLFRAMARVDPVEILDGPFIAAYLGGAMAVFLPSVLLSRYLYRDRLGTAGLFGLTAVWGNTGYMGIPLALIAFGEQAATPAIVIVVVQMALFVGLGQAMVEIDLSVRERLGGVLVDVGKALIRSPILMSPLIGLAWAFTGWDLPAPVDTYCEILGSAAGPCALFAIGLFLVGCPVRGNLGAVGIIALLKLLVQPAVTWVLAYHLLPVRADWAAVLILQAALPTGATVFVIAQKYNLFVERSSAGILVTTVLSVVSLAVLLPLLR